MHPRTSRFPNSGLRSCRFGVYANAGISGQPAPVGNTFPTSAFPRTGPPIYSLVTLGPDPRVYPGFRKWMLGSSPSMTKRSDVSAGPTPAGYPSMTKRMGYSNRTRVGGYPSMLKAAGAGTGLVPFLSFNTHPPSPSPGQQNPLCPFTPAKGRSRLKSRPAAFVKAHRCARCRAGKSHLLETSFLCTHP